MQQCRVYVRCEVEHTHLQAQLQEDLSEVLTQLHVDGLDDMASEVQRTLRSLPHQLLPVLQEDSIKVSTPSPSPAHL
jgi:hypothetical protein